MNNDTPADAELHADRLHELRREMELRFGGEFVENAVNRLDAASNFLRLSARHRTTSPPAQDGLVDALRKIADTPAWGYPERWETTPAEVRQLARAALASIEVKS